MVAMLRLGLVLLVVLTVLFVVLQLYSRSIRKEKLEKRADREIGEGRLSADERDAYIEQGLVDYGQSIRPKLIFGVYVVPIVVVAILVYVTNFM